MMNTVNIKRSFQLLLITRIYFVDIRDNHKITTFAGFPNLACIVNGRGEPINYVVYCINIFQWYVLSAMCRTHRDESIF